jgi:hypothetical protein
VEETILETRSRRTCTRCGLSVIWARIKAPPKSGGRAYVPFPVERCAAGTGNVALGLPLFAFPDGEALLAEIVDNGTTYRSHRDHCPGPLLGPSTPATAPASFSAANFGGKKDRPTTPPARRRTR